MENLPFRSPYSPNTDEDRRKMLESIGVQSVEELLCDVPFEYRAPDLKIPPPLSEFELKREIGDLAKQNLIPGEYACFLGAGSYRHHVPAVIRQLASRSEFMTAYTPYQPEVSQGTLQAHYEFQSLVCQLTNMDVANAGMYDGSTSLAEAALMATRITKRDRIGVLRTVSPNYKAVLDTFVQGMELQVENISDGGEFLDDNFACLIIQQPNFFGYFEDLQTLTNIAHSSGALVVVYSDPVSLGMFRPPGDYGADIVVAEGQSFGVAPSYGGPYVGMFACKQEYVRQMPGRVVGKTKDRRGRTGYVLTLQTREQHIRRQKATSNICTAVGLIALMATIYMASYGKKGLRHIAELCYQKAHYAASQIDLLPGYSLAIDDFFFREFVVKCPASPGKINERLLDYGIIGGLDVSDQIPNGMILCCTEVNTKEEIDGLVNALGEIGAVLHE